MSSPTSSGTGSSSARRTLTEKMIQFYIPDLVRCSAKGLEISGARLTFMSSDGKVILNHDGVGLRAYAMIPIDTTTLEGRELETKLSDVSHIRKCQESMDSLIEMSNEYRNELKAGLDHANLCHDEVIRKISAVQNEPLALDFSKELNDLRSARRRDAVDIDPDRVDEIKIAFQLINRTDYISRVQHEQHSVFFGSKANIIQNAKNSAVEESLNRPQDHDGHIDERQTEDDSSEEASNENENEYESLFEMADALRQQHQHKTAGEPIAWSSKLPRNQKRYDLADPNNRTSNSAIDQHAIASGSSSKSTVHKSSLGYWPSSYAHGCRFSDASHASDRGTIDTESILVLRELSLDEAGDIFGVLYP
ncbi:hypothetical protein CI109_100457 [Kwoniella shandongensis]|uniref:Uncharacterized protein n=1 Tax=Kwoniella shandongensis TaxID=1734106 RepID=A0A5M6C4N5_9TREE|nr:uncharacterized protein CI109_001700 [Kwoniella shandongensis]KAA5529761.1 hypothetical protein CI109_001700 [Kwoniella shandongensis]